jgi:hypothetical protein
VPPQPLGECAEYEVRHDHERTGQGAQHAHDVGAAGLRHGDDRAQVRVVELAVQPVVLDLTHLAHHQLWVEVPARIVQRVDRGEVQPGRHLEREVHDTRSEAAQGVVERARSFVGHRQELNARKSLCCKGVGFR